MHGGTGMEVHLKSKNHIKRFQSQFVGSLFWRKEKGNGGGKRKVYILFVKGGDLGFGEPVWLLT